jgi:hypothetical protein
MPDLFINFITLHPASHRTHHAISHVGLMFNHVGSLMWQLHVAVAVELIDADAQRLYFIDPIACRRREVAVERVRGRRPQLRARHQATWTDELLNLPAHAYPPHLKGVFPPG